MFSVTTSHNINYHYGVVVVSNELVPGTVVKVTSSVTGGST